MKKLSFLGMVFFAFQNIVVAQTDFSIALGTNAWWMRDSFTQVTNPISSGASIGLFASHPMLNQKITLEFGVNYIYNIATPNYKVKSTSSEEEFNQFYAESLNENIIGDYHHQLAIPILFHWNTQSKVTPFIGAEFNFKKTAGGYNDAEFIPDRGIKIGTSYTISERLKLRLAYYHGTSNEVSLDIIDNSSTENIIAKSSKLDLTLHYNFTKR